MLIELSTTGVDQNTPTKTESNPACINFGLHKKNPPTKGSNSFPHPYYIIYVVLIHSNRDDDKVSNFGLFYHIY